MINYKFIRVGKSSYKYTKELYLKAFNLKQDIDSIQKKYNTSFFGLKDIGYFALDDRENPAGYYGVFPITLSMRGEDFLVAQSGDTMTAPAHRKKGLFTTLAKKTYVLARDNNVQFIFGFPNENSYPGLKTKLNWQFYGKMQDFKLKNTTIPLCELVSKLKFLEPLYKKYCDWWLSFYIISLTEENIIGFNHNKTEGTIRKDISFFRYKQSRNAYLIRINEFVILIKPDVHLLIGDVVPFEDNKTDEFIETLKKISKKLGCRKTILSVSKNHWLYKYLSKRLQASERLPIGFLKLCKDYPFDKISFTRADYDTF